MEIKAEQKFIRMSARKVRFIAESVRRQTPGNALENLMFIQKRAAKPIIKVIKQAVANAINNYNQKEDNLLIHRIEVVEGPTYKRWQAVSRGRAHPILKRTCHIAVFLKSDDKTNESVKALEKKEIKTKNLNQKSKAITKNKNSIHNKNKKLKNTKGK
jgi:large subunit ribosomal protein L22